MGSTTSRFQPTRAGIINLWDYTDQEFSFADGRLVLRGPNGSGKTKALEVLFPFVLDGRIEPRRLNPFAGEERTMKSNLLYRGQESAHSYVWMEFLRGDRAHPEAVTVGIGMRASRQADKVTRWYFVAEGRVGTDFSLLGPDDRPLTKRQLSDELGADAITDRPIDYRHAIDARLFGLGAQRYDQLINLILTLRRPQLAKNLDPKGLSQALTDGLRPLDEQLVLEAARSFSDMEEVGKALEGLARADDAARNFMDVYSKYVRVQVRSDVEQVTRRMQAVTHAVTALFASAALRARRHDERVAAEKRFDNAERSLDQAMAYRETLRGSSAYENKRQLDDLAESAAKFQLSTRQQSERAQKSQADLEARVAENARAAAALADSATARERSEDDLQSAAEDAGIAWSPLPTGSRTDQFLNAVRGYVEERDADVRATRAALVTLDRASSERDRAAAAARDSKSQLEAAGRAVSESELATEIAREECIEHVRSWWSTNSALYTSIGVDSTVLEKLIVGVGDAGDPDAATLASILSDETQAHLDALRARQERAVTRATDIAATRATLTGDRARIASETDDAPPESAARAASRSTLAGAPLWKLVRFADDVPADVAAGIEAALHAANILDGWVLGSDAESPTLPDAEPDIFLVPTSTTSTSTQRTLADVLEIEPDTAVPAQRVADILSSIAVVGAGEPDAVNSASRHHSVRVGVDGVFWQGVQRGSSRKQVAEYIGATARARRRAARLVEIDAALESSRANHADAKAESTHAEQLLAQHSAAARSLPKTGAIVNAQRAVAEAAGALRTWSESSAAADRQLDRATAELSVCEKQLRTEAVTHRTPHKSRDLDTLAASIRHFEVQSAAVLRRRTEHVREAERASEAAARMDEAHGLAEELAEEAAISEENYQQQVSRLETLREKLGAGADRIEADLELARNAIEKCKTEQRAARKADKEAGEAIGTAEGAYTAAAESVRSAVTECRTDAGRLAPYAQSDLLDLLGIEGRYPWPASDAAWLDTEQIFYRIASADGPPDDVPVLPDVVGRLHSELSEATASIRLSDNARKSSRTALTVALQEFDAKLAASGQDYRLHWDAPDGVTVVRVQDDRGHSSIGEFSTRIALARADQELLLTESERRILEDALLTGLAQQIHERTVDARDLIAQMASEMKQRRMSSGNTIGVHWVLADSLDEGARAISKLADRDASALTVEDLAAMRAHFASEIRIARTSHPERSYPEILSTTLDYRTWRVFSFTLIGVDGSEDRLTVARHSALSGGEQSVSLHLPLFAAAHVMLSSADPHSPRLLALDEAFAGVDDNGRSELLGLSVQFDLDLFMTGYDLWITYADVPACAHYDLAHSTAENTVSAVLLVWENGELLSEHGGDDLAGALGSPHRSRVPTPIEGGLEFSTQGN